MRTGWGGANESERRSAFEMECVFNGIQTISTNSNEDNIDDIGILSHHSRLSLLGL